MTIADHDHPATERRYEIAFDGDVVDLVHRITPGAQVLAVPTYTILWEHIRTVAELDHLLEALIAMGITPQEVHDTGAGPPRPSYCEVRIGGVLGDAVLQHLGWPHRVAQSTVVLLRATQDALRHLLTQMSAVTRIDYVVALSPSR